MADFRLGQLQRRACEFLISLADEAGNVEYSFDDLAEVVGTRNLYDIFRQLHIKGIISSMPLRLTKTNYHVKLACLPELRRALDAIQIALNGSGDDRIGPIEVSMSPTALMHAVDTAIVELISEDGPSEENLALLVELKRALATGRLESGIVRVVLQKSA